MRFTQLAEADFGMAASGNEETLEELYKAEVAEHGSQNLAQYCKEKGWHVAISFPPDPDAIVSISHPFRWDITKCGTVKLVDALGYLWQEEPLGGSAEGHVYTLKKQIGPACIRDGAPCSMLQPA